MTALKPCGTEAAYRRHLRRHEPPCAACLRAHSAYHGHAELRPAKCGTESGYVRHLRLGETPCDICRAANNDASRARRRRRAREAS